MASGEEGPAPGEAERLVLAALLVLLHEGGGYKVTFTLTELLRLLGWPVAESSWEAVERALEWGMRPARSEYGVVWRAGGRGREARVTSWRRLVSGYEYSEESEDDDAVTVFNLATRRVTVTFNRDVLRGPGAPGSPP